MRIAYAIQRFYPVIGGAENVCFRLAYFMVHEGWDVKVFTLNLDQSWRRGLKQAEQVNSILIERYNWNFKLLSYYVSISMLKHMIKENFDLMHAHIYGFFPSDVAFISSKLKKRPYIITPHGFHYLVSGVRKILHKIYDNVFGRLLLSYAKFVTCVSKMEIPIVKMIAPKANVVHIPNGVDCDHLKSGNARAFLNKFNLVKPLVLTIGRVSWIKGFDRWIKVARRLREYTFVWIGPLEDITLLKRYKPPKNAVYLGKLTEEDKINALNACDVFFLPTRYEAFAIVIREAQACGKPIIATALPEFKNVSGMIPVKNGEIDQYCKAIRYAIDNRHIGLEGIKEAKKYDWRRILLRYKKLYQLAVTQ